MERLKAYDAHHPKGMTLMEYNREAARLRRVLWDHGFQFVEYRK